MPLPAQWGTPEDFATMFQYFWHRDFPIDQIYAVGAQRTDWTIHIGVIVRNIADLMGLVTRFEARGRRDAVLRSAYGDEIALEWEWEGVGGNELDKLKNHKVWSKDKTSDRFLRFAVFITYAHMLNPSHVYEHVKEKWEGSRWPLLLIIIKSVESKTFSTRRQFDIIEASVFESDQQTILRTAPALPWNVEGSRWSSQWR